MDSIPIHPALEDNKKIVLTDSQCLVILKEWDSRPNNPPSVGELIELVFPDIEEKFKDPRTKYGRVIKEYLISKDLKQSNNTPPPPILKEEDKEYILNHCSTMKVMEMCKEIFKNPRIGANSLEVMLVKNFINSDVPKETLYDKNESLDTGGFRPPKTIEQAAYRINTHVEGANFDSKKVIRIYSKIHSLNIFKIKLI